MFPRNGDYDKMGADGNGSRSDADNLSVFFKRYTEGAMERQGGSMVKHIILWTLKDTLSEEEKRNVKAGIKEGLEGLAGRIPGMLQIRVQTEKLESSNADLMLDSSFESEEALKGYAVHPDHVKVADEKVRPYTAVRSCLDFEV